MTELIKSNFKKKTVRISIIFASEVSQWNSVLSMNYIISNGSELYLEYDKESKKVNIK